MPVIHNVVFDTQVSQGASGGPKFFTTIIAATGGYEKTVANWAAARSRYDVGHVIQNRAKLAYVIAFFRARVGRAFGFLFRDPLDFYAGMTWANNALTASAIPEILAITGTGAVTAFQLTKTYSDAGATQVRNITRPIQTDFVTSASVAPGVYTNNGGGWVLKTVTTDYTINFTTGVVTFVVAPANAVQIGWSGQFYVPVRFDTDEMHVKLEAAGVGEWASIPLVEVRE